VDCDILIKNASIIDGTGKDAIRGDILIQDGLIADIGSFPYANAKTVINAEDKIVSPGFIDIHTHFDFLMPSSIHVKRLMNWIQMGVTTVVCGNCGYSAAPMNQSFAKNYNQYWNFAVPQQGLQYSWDSMAEYISFIEDQGILCNVAMLTGHSSLRINSLGFAARNPSDIEMRTMKKNLEESIEQGSLGLSLGLTYVPGCFSNTDEIVSLSSVLTKYNAPLVVHPRSMGKFYKEAIEEVICIAEKNRIPLHISHHAGGGFSKAVFDEISQLIKTASERGVVIHYDNIPWANFTTSVFSLFPPLEFEQGMDNFFEKISDKKERERIIQKIKTFVPKWPAYENEYWADNYFDPIYIMNGFRLEKNKQFENKNLMKICKALNKEPIETLIDLLLEEGNGLFYTYGYLDFPAGDDYQGYLLSHPDCSIGSDMVGIDYDTNNPVAFGTFTKVIQKFVKEKKIFKLEEAIRKMTSLPAQQLGIQKRGKIEKGYFADLVIFDYENIGNNSSYRGSNKLSEGIENVIINGKLVLAEGHFNNLLCGKVVRRVI
jgi:N-acyl-D-amino-acid deacylase